MPPADRNEYDAWLRLTLVPGLGNATLRKLLLEFGSPDHVFAAHLAELRRFVAADIAAQLVAGGNAEGAQQALVWLADSANHVVALGDADYPQLLLQTTDPPPLLYVKGRRELLNRVALAIVGSRNATAQGVANAEDFARALSDAGITIVSGLALGIDAAAHRGGLAGAAGSIAVVGTGLDVVYPARNRTLAHQLAERGALVSEFALGTPALGANFPRRNRVISGMSRGCLVVEAALQSGSLITARFANEQGREVFALPGSIHSPLAKGCHALIKQGAKLVDCANDILEELNLAPAPSAARAMPALDPAAAQLLDLLGYAPRDLDALCARSGMGADAISVLLLELELQGLVETLPGGQYQRVR
ncbi:MAG: DNA-protecting protein DprA [Betaproteobacteria bacterium]|nr:DNA-protecting protein DprA [Betaproteobacteria bacterium]